MSTVSQFLKEVSGFCREFEISETTFSRRFANDGKFVDRLKRGKDLTVGTLDRARAYMADQRAARRQPKRKAA